MDNKEIQMRNTVNKAQLLDALKLIKMTCIGSACVLCPLRSVAVSELDSHKCAIVDNIPANWDIKTIDGIDWRAFNGK